MVLLFWDTALEAQYKRDFGRLYRQFDLYCSCFALLAALTAAAKLSGLPAISSLATAVIYCAALCMSGALYTLTCQPQLWLRVREVLGSIVVCVCAAADRILTRQVYLNCATAAHSRGWWLFWCLIFGSGAFSLGTMTLFYRKRFQVAFWLHTAVALGFIACNEPIYRELLTPCCSQPWQPVAAMANSRLMPLLPLSKPLQLSGTDCAIIAWTLFQVSVGYAVPLVLVYHSEVRHRTMFWRSTLRGARFEHGGSQAPARNLDEDLVKPCDGHAGLLFTAGLLLAAAVVGHDVLLAADLALYFV